MSKSIQPKQTTKLHLGRLKSLGISEPWQVAFLLPEGWDDYRLVIKTKPSSDIARACVEGVIRNTETRFDKYVRTVCRMTLSDESVVSFILFGDTRSLTLEKGTRVLVYGCVSKYLNDVWIEGAVFVPEEMVGHLIPRYKGLRGVIQANLVRERVLPLLYAAIPVAANWLIQTAGGLLDKLPVCNGKSVCVDDILKKAHLPGSIDEGVAAHKWLEQVAALHLAHTLTTERKKMTKKAVFSTPLLQNIKTRASALPFKLTEEQKTCVREGLYDIINGTMHRILSGDVGTGKTAVYGLIAALCVDGGARVAILAPNQALVRQIHAEISLWWADLQPQLVTKDTSPLEETRLFIGTTALLTRPIPPFSLVIIDEQHKFSREQREKLVSDGVHLLEVSATCIPRSQALIRYGSLRLSKLEHCHVEKNIKTTIWLHEDKSELFAHVKNSIARGDKVLVIYPKREGSEEGKLPSAEQALALWSKAFPGKVRLAHGGLPSVENQQSIDDVSSGVAPILISTTVVEVGMNIHGLRHAIVVHAERFGLTTLHQIRGRLARAGGSGLFDLYLPNDVKENVHKRLSVLEETCDGFRVSEMDMRLRGFGDLSSTSNKQTGSDDTFLIGHPVSVDDMDAAIDLL